MVLSVLHWKLAAERRRSKQASAIDTQDTPESTPVSSAPARQAEPQVYPIPSDIRGSAYRRREEKAANPGKLHNTSTRTRGPPDGLFHRLPPDGRARSPLRPEWKVPDPGNSHETTVPTPATVDESETTTPTRATVPPTSEPPSQSTPQPVLLPLFHRSSNKPTTTDLPPKMPLKHRLHHLRKFLAFWLKVSWADILTLIVLGLATQRIYALGATFSPKRLFPVTFLGSGDIVYPQFAYPYRGWIISPMVSGLLSVWVPIAIFLVGQIRIRSFWDLNNAVMGMLYANVLGSLFQVVVKQLIGGIRPYFLEVCRPDLTLEGGLNGVGFHGLMYSVEVCTNPDNRAVHNAMTSFPSGHATVAFSSLVFVFLWMNGKMKVWGNYRTGGWWLALLSSPLLGATLLAACLTIDAAHNWYDILVGAVIGTVFAFGAYRVMYAAVWDWRWNHVPLRRDGMFAYRGEVGREVLEGDLFVRKNGWGRRRRKGRWGRWRMDKTKPAAVMGSEKDTTREDPSEAWVDDGKPKADVAMEGETRNRGEGPGNDVRQRQGSQDNGISAGEMV